MSNNNSAKQMMDIQKMTSVPAALSDEQQRKWSEDMFNRKVENPINNYDKSRTHLNFQVGLKGVIQKVDQSKTIGAKIDQQIQNRVTGSIRCTSNRAISIIYGGNREVMRELAFGKQTIQEDSDNNHIKRQKGIENWARDMYDFNCREFGEENIASFIVHLDETNPHIHCMIVPITPDGRLSAKDVIGGKDKNAAKRNLQALHDRLAKINAKYNLERGDNISITGAKHRSIETYRYDIQKEIFQNEKAIKSLNTMIKNRQEEIIQLEKQIAEAKGDVGKLAQLQEKLDEVKFQLIDKQEKLTIKINELNSLEGQVKAKSTEVDKLADLAVKTIGTIKSFNNAIASEMLLNRLVFEITTRFSDMPFQSQEKWEGTLLGAIATDRDVLKDTIQLFLIGAGLDGAHVSVGTAGGGGDNSLKKDDKETEREFFERCFRFRMGRTRGKGGKRR